jgi:hypothetical protein
MGITDVGIDEEWLLLFGGTYEYLAKLLSKLRRLLASAWSPIECHGNLSGGAMPDISEAREASGCRASNQRHDP